MLFNFTLGVVLLSAGLRYLLQLTLARNLPVNEVGIYSYCLAWAEFLAIPLTLGFDLASVRFVSKYLAQGANKYLVGFFTSSCLISLLGTVGLGLLLFLFWIVSKALNLAIDGRFLCWIFLFATLVGFIKLFTEQLKSLDSVVVAFLTSQALRPLLTFSSIFIFLLFQDGLKLVDVIMSTLISLTCVLCAQIILLKPKIEFKSGKQFEISKWFGTSVLLLGISIGMFLQQQIDLFILGTLRPFNEVGVYSVVSKLAMILTFPMFAINGSYVPKLTYLFESGEYRKFNRTYKGAVLKGFGATFIGFCGFILFGKKMLALFGENYSEYSSVLLILGTGHLINAGLGLSVFVLAATGFHHQVFRSFGVSLLVTAPLMYLLIPTYNLWGAAFAISGGTLCLTTISTYDAFKKLFVHR